MNVWEEATIGSDKMSNKSKYETDVKSKFEEIKKWLITDDFCEFISYDNLDFSYYFKCIKIQQ